MGYFKKKPAELKLEPLNDEEKGLFEALARRDKALKTMMGNLTEQHERAEELRAEFWEKVKENRNLEEPDGTVRVNKDGDLILTKE